MAVYNIMKFYYTDTQQDNNKHFDKTCVIIRNVIQSVALYQALYTCKYSKQHKNNIII